MQSNGEKIMLLQEIYKQQNLTDQSESDSTRTRKKKVRSPVSDILESCQINLEKNKPIYQIFR